MSQQVERAAAAEAARDEALDRVAKGAGSEWVDHALGMIRLVALSRREFTSDDVWTVLEQPPNDPRALGAAMKMAVNRGICMPTGVFRRSVRVACHRRPVAVWSSCVYVGGET